MLAIISFITSLLFYPLQPSISDNALAKNPKGTGYPLCIGASSIGSNAGEEGDLILSRSLGGKLIGGVAFSVFSSSLTSCVVLLGVCFVTS